MVSAELMTKMVVYANMSLHLEVRPNLIRREEEKKKKKKKKKKRHEGVYLQSEKILHILYFCQEPCMSGKRTLRAS